MAAERGTGGNTGGIGLGGILVIVGIVLMIVWSFWLGLIVTLVGLIAFGGFAKASGTERRTWRSPWARAGLVVLGRARDADPALAAWTEQHVESAPYLEAPAARRPADTAPSASTRQRGRGPVAPPAPLRFVHGATSSPPTPFRF